MPKSNHKESRLMFIKEAKKLDRKVFNQWFRLIPNLKRFILKLDPKNFNKSILFISGQEDFLFSKEVYLFTKKIKTLAIVVLKPQVMLSILISHMSSIKSSLNFLNLKITL